MFSFFDLVICIFMSETRKFKSIMKIISNLITIISNIGSMYFKINLLSKTVGELIPLRQKYLFIVMSISDIILFGLSHWISRLEKKRFNKKKEFKLHVDWFISFVLLIFFLVQNEVSFDLVTFSFVTFVPLSWKYIFKIFQISEKKNELMQN